jgi:molybdopterin-guanine dinucleotide biosynthesis protein A
MTFTGVLLAGGLSRRMGRDKATLDFQGTPLWSRQIDLLRLLSLETILISSRSAPPWAPTDIEVLLDRPPSRGPLSGISAALFQIRSSHLLALAVDLPQLTTEHVRKILSLVRPGQGVVPFNQDHYEPLMAVYPREAASMAQEALQSDEFSLQSFVRELKQENLLLQYIVAPEETSQYRNLNGPEDLQP